MDQLQACVRAFDRTALSQTQTKFTDTDGSCVLVENCAAGEGAEVVVDTFKEPRPALYHLKEKAEVEVDTTAVPRFSAHDLASTPGAMLDYLDTHGYVVVGDCFTPTEVEHAHSLVWQFLEGRGVRKDDLATWCGDAWPADHSTGIISRFGFSHSDFCWHARENAHVRRVFALVHGARAEDEEGSLKEDCTEDHLITSFDGGNLFRPWQDRPQWKTSGGWFHVDQNTRTGKVGRCCVQGIAAFTDATAATGGLVVVPGSHKKHQEVCDAWGENKGDFVPVGRGDPMLQKPSKLVTAKAGDLILWDSRTVHCNTPGVVEATAATGTATFALLCFGVLCVLPPW